MGDEPEMPGRRAAVAAGFGVLFVATGVHLAFGILFKPILTDLGSDRSTLALAPTAGLLVNALGQPVLGVLVDHWGPRRIILGALALMAAGTGLVSLAQGAWQVVLLYGVVAAVGSAGAGVLPVSVHVTRWFPQERGSVMALAATGFSLGHLVFTQLAAHAEARLGWRATYLALAGVLVLVWPLFLVWLRDAPRGAVAVPSASALVPAVRPSLDRRAALSTGGFWALTAGLMGCGFTDFLMTTHLAPHATDLGLSPAVAANAVSLWAAANVGGLLVAGGLAARVGARPALVLTYALRALALLYLLAVREPWQLYLFAVLFGATFFTTAPLSSTLVATLFGPAHHGAIFGAANLFHHVAGALGAYGGGVAFDRAGGYRPIFALGALAVVGSAAVSARARPPASRAPLARDGGGA